MIGEQVGNDWRVEGEYSIRESALWQRDRDSLFLNIYRGGESLVRRGSEYDFVYSLVCSRMQLQYRQTQAQQLKYPQSRGVSLKYGLGAISAGSAGLNLIRIWLDTGWAVCRLQAGWELNLSYGFEIYFRSSGNIALKTSPMDSIILPNSLWFIKYS